MGGRTRMAQGKKGTAGETNITAKVADELVRVLEMGQPINVACRFAGISDTTFHKWVKLGAGQPASTLLGGFAVRVSKAKETAKLTALKSVFKGMGHDWKAGAWFLGVTQPKEFGPKIKVTVEAELGAAMERLSKALPEEWYARAVDALVGGVGEEGAVALAGLAPGESVGISGAAAGFHPEDDAEVPEAGAPGGGGGEA